MTNTGNQMIAYEDFMPDWYTITLNPSNDYQFWDNPERLEDFLKHHINYLKKCNLHTNVFQLELWPEISKHGRLHFHGYIKVFEKRLFYISTLYKLQKQYQYSIDTFNNQETWDNYCTKQCDFHTAVRKELKKIAVVDSIPIKIGYDFKLMTKDFFTSNIKTMD